MKKEIWKNISLKKNKEFETYYQVSNLGRVRSNGKIVSGTRRTLPPKEMKPYIDRASGRLRVSLYYNNRKINMTVHTLVANAFVENPFGYHFVFHIDGNKKNNRADNLIWRKTNGN